MVAFLLITISIKMRPSISNDIIRHQTVANTTEDEEGKVIAILVKAKYLNYMRLIDNNFFSTGITNEWGTLIVTRDAYYSIISSNIPTNDQEICAGCKKAILSDSAEQNYEIPLPSELNTTIWTWEMCHVPCPSFRFRTLFTEY